LFENEKEKYVPNLCALEKDKKFLRKIEDGK
jgi:hypothetical protein